MNQKEFQSACREVGGQIVKAWKHILDSVGNDSSQFSIGPSDLPTFSTLSQFYSTLFDGEDSRFIVVRRDGFEESLVKPNSLIEIPSISQENDYFCWPCGAMAVANHFGVGPTDQKEWAELLGTTEKDSTDPLMVVENLQELGLSVVLKENMTLDDLMAAWCEGRPVLTAVQEYDSPGEKVKAKRNYGHCLVVIGGPDMGYLFVYDPSASNVLVGEDSAEASCRNMIKEQDFLDRWHDRQYIRLGIIVGPKVAEISAKSD